MVFPEVTSKFLLPGGLWWLPITQFRLLTLTVKSLLSDTCSAPAKVSTIRGGVGVESWFLPLPDFAFVA